MIDKIDGQQVATDLPKTSSLTRRRFITAATKVSGAVAAGLVCGEYGAASFDRKRRIEGGRRPQGR